MSKGKIIVVEGTDCSGKETQTKLLEEKLKKLGKKCVRISFPRYDTPTGKIIAGPCLGNQEVLNSFFEEGFLNVDPYIVCLYYAADRKYNSKEIFDYLNKGYYVILDRYTTSNLAHQGSKIADKDERFNMYNWIDKLEYWLLQLPKPDKTIFLHMPYKYSKILMQNRKVLDEAEKSEEHLRKSEEAYIELSKLYNWDSNECVSDDNIKSIEDINDEIMNIIKESFDL